jgi:hypothetical protein
MNYTHMLPNHSFGTKETKICEGLIRFASQKVNDKKTFSQFFWQNVVGKDRRQKNNLSKS